MCVVFTTKERQINDVKVSIEATKAFAAVAAKCYLFGIRPEPMDHVKQNLAHTALTTENCTHKWGSVAAAVALFFLFFLFWVCVKLNDHDKNKWKRHGRINCVPQYRSSAKISLVIYACWLHYLLSFFLFFILSSVANVCSTHCQCGGFFHHLNR